MKETLKSRTFASNCLKSNKKNFSKSLHNFVLTQSSQKVFFAVQIDWRKLLSQRLELMTLHCCSHASIRWVWYFVKSRFEWEPLMLEPHMIPYLKALDVGSRICQEQVCSSIWDNHATFLIKNTLLKEEVTWYPLIEQQSCSPSILVPLIKEPLGKEN